MTPVFRSRADEAEFTTDEGRWQLAVTTDDGDKFVFDIHGITLDVADNALRTIIPYTAEAHAARLEPHLTEEDLEAYEPGDPKRITLERQLRKEHTL